MRAQLSTLVESRRGEGACYVRESGLFVHLGSDITPQPLESGVRDEIRHQAEQLHVQVQPPLLTCMLNCCAITALESGGELV